MRILLCACLLVMAGACVKEGILNFNDFQSHIVVNAVLEPDSAMKVNITASVCSDQPDIFPGVHDAIVDISDGSEQFRLIYTGAGDYGYPVKPVSGKTYSLKVYSADGKKMTASSHIPKVPDIKVTPIPGANYVQVSIADDPSSQNVYWIGSREFNVDERRYTFYENYVYSGSLMFDDFNRIHTTDMLGRTTYAYQFYARLPDFSFNGKGVIFNVSHKWLTEEEFKHGKSRKLLYIINADLHLDQYMKAALVQYDLGVIGDMPVFHTPISIYSNITNGKGIFGSCTITQFDITKP